MSCQRARRLPERQHGREGDHRCAHDHEGGAQIVCRAMDQPGRDQRRQSADDAEGRIEAERNRRAARGRRRRFDHEGGLDAERRADQEHQSELAQHHQRQLVMLHQLEQRNRGHKAKRDGCQQQPLSADAVAEPAGGQHDRQQEGHGERVDAERMRRCDAVDSLQPARDVEKHQVEADGVEHREARQLCQ